MGSCKQLENACNGQHDSKSQMCIRDRQKEGCPEEDYAAAAAREAIRMRDQILARIGKITL